MDRPAHITEKHIENGRVMRQVVQDDIGRKGYTFEQSVDALAAFLGISPESVKLGIAIANEWEPAAVAAA